MRITVKMSDDTVVICSKCKWSGCIDLANWMQEVEFGYCPKCGSAEFDDLETWEQVDYDEDTEEAMYKHLQPWKSEWTWTGWKARAAVWGLLFGFLVFILIPWGFGVYHIVKDWIV